MLSPSDFNNAVPQFTNGTYASNPINPQYIAEPGATDYNRGVEPLQTLPAQWWNWLCNKFTTRFNKINIYVKNIFNELTQLLSLMNVTPDGTETTPTIAQLKNAFENIYPGIVSTKLDLPNTYVPQTTEVNGHALSSNVTVTKTDVGLSDVVNTGDSDVPVEGGTTKFTTGGAYTELQKKVSASLLNALVPVGIVLPWFSDTVPNDHWHSADGSAFNTATYPELALVYPSGYLPDTREAALTGIGTRSSESGYVSDAFTVGEFKDFQLQNHGHSVTDPGHKHTYQILEFTASQHVFAGGSQLKGPNFRGIDTTSNTTNISVGNPNSGSHGTVTRGKRIGCNFIVRMY